ncbi:flagellar export protein FliJ [Rhizobiales bacterium TNE-4]|nr:flagellar export protein FliJ [Rhizobiales bacterium TNE-4]MBV1827838.1 flagellar export protein FliJ [Rhizobiales bacterium TNE-4]
MKSRDTLLRLKRFQVDERRRRVTQIETMIAEFERMVADLEREVEQEEQKAGINDKAHFAYPTYARAALQRRDNLQRSADELRAQLVDARDELTESVEELKKFEIIDDREQQRERAIESAREQVELDRMAYRVRGGFAGA